MAAIDWLIACCPLVAVLALIAWAQRHVKTVADFLTGGRVAGRYLLAVSGLEASTGVFGLLAVYEANYQSGFAYSFWWGLNVPVLLLMALTGYCSYRFRETRAMTMGQFLEMRYSRRFRLFAGTLQSISGVINYGLFPAVSGRFFVYFCGLPVQMHIAGFDVPTYVLIMAGYLSLVAFLAGSGGQLSIMVVDCIVAVLNYPMYLCLVAYILWKYSWFKDLAPALLDRPAGHSLINPFDIAELRDFNLFYILVGIFSGIINRMSWSGNQGFWGAAKSPHEGKMAGVLATWRSGFAMMMYILVPVLAIAFFRNANTGSDRSRVELGSKAAQEVLSGADRATIRQQVVADLTMSNGTEVDKRISNVADIIRSSDPANAQTFNTIYRQMSVPMALRYILPTGLLGMFCALCIGTLIATDASYQHSWGSIIVQDVVLPLRGERPLSQAAHLWLLRIAIALVAVFAFVFSCIFGQFDFILMFQAITGAIWLGGAGPCIVGGLYWKRGTTAAAWCTLITGSSLAVASILLQKYWVGVIYPWLVHKQLDHRVGSILESLSSPFEPIIRWRMTPDSFPINSQEMFAISMLAAVGMYLVISLLTCRQPHNMDQLLRRGRYRHPDDAEPVRTPLGVRNFFSQLIGIDSQYSRGDRILAYSVFVWSFGWTFGVCFVLVAIWNWISPWSKETWSTWFFVNNFLIAGLIGLVSTVWFTYGGARDLRRLIRDLAARHRDVSDDGSVESAHGSEGKDAVKVGE